MALFLKERGQVCVEMRFCDCEETAKPHKKPFFGDKSGWRFFYYTILI